MDPFSQAACGFGGGWALGATCVPPLLVVAAATVAVLLALWAFAGHSRAGVVVLVTYMVIIGIALVAASGMLEPRVVEIFN